MNIIQKQARPKTFWQEVHKQNQKRIQGFELFKNYCEDIATLLNIPPKSPIYKIPTKKFRVLITGTFSAGKSTLINALLGKCILPARNSATTERPTTIQDIDKLKGFNITAYDDKGNPMPTIVENNSSIAQQQLNQINSEDFIQKIEINADIPWIDNDFLGNLCLIDIPGFNNANNEKHRETTTRLMQNNNYDLLLILLNYTNALTNDNEWLIQLVKKLNAEKKTVIVVNKVDNHDPDPVNDGPFEKAMLHLAKKLQPLNLSTPPFPVSALKYLKILLSDNPNIEEDIKELKGLDIPGLFGTDPQSMDERIEVFSGLFFIKNHIYAKFIQASIPSMLPQIQNTISGLIQQRAVVLSELSDQLECLCQQVFGNKIISPIQKTTSNTKQRLAQRLCPENFRLEISNFLNEHQPMVLGSSLLNQMEHWSTQVKKMGLFQKWAAKNQLKDGLLRIKSRIKKETKHILKAKEISFTIRGIFYDEN